MIKTYRHIGLKDLFETGKTARIEAKFHARLIELLDVMNRAGDFARSTCPAIGCTS